MIRMKKILVGVMLCYMGLANVNSQPVTLFSPREIRNDLEYLRKTLEASHYDFYALTEKEVLDSLYNKLEMSIHDSLSALQVFRLFQPYVVASKMSHCYMDYPWNDYFGDYIPRGGTVFPMDLYFLNNKVRIKANFSGNSLIENNDEILALNNKSMEELLEDMYQYVPGPTEYYKNSRIEQITFSRLYWFCYEPCDTFQMTIRKKNGEEIELALEAIPGKEFEEKNRKEASMFRPYREFYMIDDVAYLHPGGFLNANSNFDMRDPKTFDNTEFRHFIDSAFTVFREADARNLIIDLRYNPGGDNSFSDYMVAYFASKPFSFSSGFTIRTSQITKDFWKQVSDTSLNELKERILSHANGETFETDVPFYEPVKNSLRFQGKVYVLINRYSYSNTASVAAIIQDYKFGKIIGEETAEIVSSYGATHKFILPNTKWSVTFPKAFIQRPNGDISQRGVIPDYKIADNLFTVEDEVLEYTLELIKND